MGTFGKPKTSEYLREGTVDSLSPRRVFPPGSLLKRFHLLIYSILCQISSWITCTASARGTMRLSFWERSEGRSNIFPDVHAKISWIVHTLDITNHQII